MPALSAATPAWVKRLRPMIRAEHGAGWGVREQTGKVKLIRRWDDGSQSAAVLPITWDRSSTSEILNAITSIKGRMEASGLDLAEAARLQARAAEVSGNGTGAHVGAGGAGGGCDAAAIGTGVDWQVVVEKFALHKTAHTGDCRPDAFQRNWRTHLHQLLEVMAATPKPRTGRAVLDRMRDRFGGEPGSKGRKRRIQNIAAVLRFAVAECGAPQAWAPPAEGGLGQWIGSPKRKDANGEMLPGGGGDATPLLDEQLVELLASLPTTRIGRRWRMAIGLCAVFGLRPVELRHIRPTADGRRLHCSYVKETAKGSTKPGEIIGLDPLGAPGLAQELLAELLVVQMPPLGNGPNTAASALDTYLRRRPVWERLKAEAEAAGQHLTCYSLRHGYSYRAHIHAELPVRVAAQQMRHSLQTHLRHYGQWCDAETAEAVMRQGAERLAAKQAALTAAAAAAAAPAVA